MKNLLFIFLFILTGITSGYSQGDEQEKPIEVSLEELIQNPMKFNRKYISVYGYLKFEKGGHSLAVSEEDFKNNNSKKIVWFLFNVEGSTYPTVEKYNGKYAVITGFYNSGKVYSGDEKLSSENGLISEVSISFRN